MESWRELPVAPVALGVAEVVRGLPGRHLDWGVAELGGLDVGGARISEIMSPELIRGLVSEAAPMDPDVIGVRFSGALGFDVDSVLREVACPVRLVRGNPELGGLVLEKDARRIQANSSDFEERYDSKAGHGIHRKPFDRAFAEDIRLLTDLVS